MTTHTTVPGPRAVGDYELWFVCQLTFGLAYLGGAMFLLPQFVLGLPGSNPGDVGIVMGVLPLIALGAPIVGGLLDRFGSHRAFQHLGLALLAVGFGVLSVADELISTTVGALVLGIGAALAMTTNLSLLAGSGLPGDVRARRLALLQMSLPAGQVLGLLVVAVLLVAGTSFEQIFLVLAVICLIGLAATAATNKEAVDRALETANRHETNDPTDDDHSDARGLGAVLWSTFGLVLLVVFVSMTAHSGIESQYPNFMSSVYGIDGQLAAVGLAVAVLLSLPVYPAVGRWAQTVPFRTPLLLGILLRALCGLALWVLAEQRDVPQLVPLAVFGFLLLVIPLTDITGSLLAASSSPIGPGGGQGGYGFALAAAGVAGALLAGWAASEFGYRSLALIVAMLSVVAFLLGCFLPSLGAARSGGNRDADTLEA